MQPLAAGRQLIGFGGEARRDEPGREGALQHARTNRIGQGRLRLKPSKRQVRLAEDRLAALRASEAAGTKDFDHFIPRFLVFGGMFKI
jgi:hypothetical protein